MVFAAGFEILNVVLLPAQKLAVPKILGAFGAAFTVILLVCVVLVPPRETVSVTL